MRELLNAKTPFHAAIIARLKRSHQSRLEMVIGRTPSPPLMSMSILHERGGVATFYLDGLCLKANNSI
jgi:hypothetical protein